MKIKFGLTFGLNVARLGLDETQVITAAQIADRTNFDSVWAMDHTNVPQWKNAVVNGDAPDFEKLKDSLILLGSQEDFRNNMIYYIDE